MNIEERRKYYREYYSTHKETPKKYYQKNKKWIYAKQKTYRKAHPEKRRVYMRAYMKKYYVLNKEKFKEYYKKYKAVEAI